MIDALKRQLKAQAVTYAELGKRIGLSEPSVKRMFAQRSFTLERLEQVLEVVGMDFAELAQAATNAPQLISQLTYAQEQEIIGDTKLLVVAVAALNQIPVEEIVAVYRLSEAETVKYLLRLDRIGFLTLLPNNRVKLLVSRTFSWIPNGPIQTWFRQEASGDSLDAVARFHQGAAGTPETGGRRVFAAAPGRCAAAVRAAAFDHVPAGGPAMDAGSVPGADAIIFRQLTNTPTRL
jgi:transcriptional regulator with XRE-family HTH domain